MSLTNLGGTVAELVEHQPLDHVQRKQGEFVFFNINLRSVQLPIISIYFWSRSLLPAAGFDRRFFTMYQVVGREIVKEFLAFTFALKKSVCLLIELIVEKKDARKGHMLRFSNGVCISLIVLPYNWYFVWNSGTILVSWKVLLMCLWHLSTCCQWFENRESCLATLE